MTAKEMKTGTKVEAEKKLNRAAVLLDNLVRAVESRDESNMIQAAGAGREYLDTDGER